MPHAVQHTVALAHLPLITAGSPQNLQGTVSVVSSLFFSFIIVFSLDEFMLI